MICKRWRYLAFLVLLARLIGLWNTSRNILLLTWHPLILKIAWALIVRSKSDVCKGSGSAESAFIRACPWNSSWKLGKFILRKNEGPICLWSYARVVTAAGHKNPFKKSAFTERPLANRLIKFELSAETVAFCFIALRAPRENRAQQKRIAKN